MSGGDPELLFAYRRKLTKELSYDERSKPAQRKALKRRKLIGQQGKCAICSDLLPPVTFGAVLDRLNAIYGYSKANTCLICRDCDLKARMNAGFSAERGLLGPETASSLNRPAALSG